MDNSSIPIDEVNSPLDVSVFEVYADVSGAVAAYVDLTDSDVDDNMSPSVTQHNIQQSPAGRAAFDDSLSILYEKIEPQPELAIINEINITDSPHSGVTSASDSSSSDCIEVQQFREVLRDNSHPISPIIFGSTNEPPIAEIVQHRDIQTAYGYLARAVRGPRNERNEERPERETTIECEICFEEYFTIINSGRNFMSTICGHIFCESCLKLAVKEKKECPKCRKRLTPKQIHPIYFTLV